MTQAKVRFTSIEEYAALESSDLPECRFELVNGEIIEMGAENYINITIAGYLFSVLLPFVPHYRIKRGCEIAVSSRLVTCREPDLLVLTEAGHQALPPNQRAIITKVMPTPALVVEVVSPGDADSPNYQRDYKEKPAEYSVRGIPEYWRIDPNRNVVAVLWLVDEDYRVSEFRGSAAIASPTFPNLNLTAEQILNAGL